MTPDFNKGAGLIPAIIQHAETQQVLMLGYMNEAAFHKTQKEGKVTFYSRSKNRLWTKGETSQNYLWVQDIQLDCDQDTLLVKVLPDGPACHKGSTSCFGEETAKGFLYALENTIHERIDSEKAESYTYQLFKKGINKVAQKVGEEAVETIIEAKDNNNDLFLNESADLLYHLLILLKAKEVRLFEVEQLLKDRSKG